MRTIFKKLFGNDSAKSRIGSAIIADRLNHALIICGPDGSGKTTLALEISAALNCENKRSENHPLPCGVCNRCRRIYSGNFTDVTILEKEPSKATIGVDELRKIREEMYLSAIESSYKVYIIKDADKMTVNAQNALLKVFEEPPAGVIMMLLCEEIDKMLITIKSRAQRITMQRFSPEEMLSYISKSRGSVSDPERLRDDIMSAEGRIGRAIEIIESPEAVEGGRRITLDIIEAMLPGAPYSALLSAMSSLSQKRPELKEELEALVLALADLIKLKYSESAPLSFFSNREEALSLASKMATKKLSSIYDSVKEAIDENSKNANISALITNLGAKIKLN